MATDPTQRFSDRAVDYARSRPHYPEAVLTTLRAEAGLNPDWTIADVGSGTGRLTALLLTNGNRVFGVEPNDAMRAQAEAELAAQPGFVSLGGRSEATGLPDASVDLITVAQALHWFEPQATRAEFRRILRPGGWLAVVINQRLVTGLPLMEEVQALLDEERSRPAPGEARWDVNYERLDHYYGFGRWRLHTSPNCQVLDADGFVGLWNSRSTMPAPGTPGHEELLAGLRRIFANHQQDGRVTIAYETRVYLGQPQA